MTKSEILLFLQTHKEELYEKYGLTKIGLFGSYAQGGYTDESDIDLYAEFKEKKFRHIAGAWNYLEDNLGRKVDLFYPHKNMRASLKENIEKDVLYG